VSASLFIIVVSLVHWRNPVLSMMVFLCIELFCYLVAVQDYTIITLVCYLILVQLIVCLCYVNGTRWWLRFQGKSIPPDQFFSPREPLLDSEKLRFLLEPSSSCSSLLSPPSTTSSRSVSTSAAAWTTLAPSLPSAFLLSLLASGSMSVESSCLLC